MSAFQSQQIDLRPIDQVFKAHQQNGFGHILKVEHALTVGQARSRFGLGRTDLARLEDAGLVHLCTHCLSRSGDGKRFEITFVCRNARTAARPDDSLRHLAGVAEMRCALRADLLHWNLKMLANPQRNYVLGPIPDAIWEMGNVKVAIEFDAGTHTLATVQEKILAYAQHYPSQIWAVSSGQRGQNILAEFERSGLPALSWRVMQIDWMHHRWVSVKP